MSRANARRQKPNHVTQLGMLLAAVVAVLSVGFVAHPAAAVPAQKSPSSTQASVSTTKSSVKSSSTYTASTYTASTYPPSSYVPTTPSTVATTAPPTTEAATTTEAPSTAASFADAGGVQPFPAPLVGPVPAAEVPVERLMTNVYATASTDPERPQVVVQFKSPFTLPPRPYRVSVLVGDPGGAQLRASLIGNGAGLVSWKLEKAPTPPPGSGANVTPVWSTVDSNDKDASFSASGLVAVTVPLKEAPEGSAVWAEIESGSDGKQVSTSPYFSRAAMFNEVNPGQLPSSTVGTVVDADGTPSGQFVDLPAGPVLSLADKTIQLKSSDRPPTQLAGQKVDKAFEFVRIAPSFNKRAVVTDYIFVDRSSGEVQLLDGFTVPPTDKTAQAEWVKAGLPQGDPSAPGQLQFDLGGVSRALGIQLSTNATGFGVRREYVLADGRRVVAEAVLGTVSWLGADQIEGLDRAASAPTGPPVGPLVDTDDADATSRVLTIVGVAVGVAFVVLAAVIIVVRRRRRRARGDAADLLDAIAVETKQHRAVLREERRATGPVPVVNLTAEPDPEVTPAEGLAALVNTGPADAVDDAKRRRRKKASKHEASVDAAGATDVAAGSSGRGQRAATSTPVTASADAPAADADEPSPHGLPPAASTPVVASTPVAADASVAGLAPLRPGGAKPTIDADPVWADDVHTSGERPIISARSVRPAGARRAPAGGSATAGLDPESDPKLRSTFRSQPDKPSALQPIAPRGRKPEQPASPGPERPARSGGRTGERVPPSKALADLGAEFDELTKRLERLEATPSDVETNA